MAHHITGTFDEIIDKYPLVYTNVRADVRPLQHYTGAHGWEFSSGNANHQGHEFVSETATFVTITLPNSDKNVRYRKVTLRDDMGWWGGGMVECAFKDVKEFRDYVATRPLTTIHKGDEVFKVNGLLVKVPTDRPLPTTFRVEILRESRFLPVKMVWVGAETHVEFRHGRIRPYTSVFYSPVKTDRAYKQMPVERWDNLCYYEPERRISFPLWISDSTMDGVSNVFLNPDGTETTGDRCSKEFMDACSIDLVLHEVQRGRNIIGGKVYPLLKTSIISHHEDDFLRLADVRDLSRAPSVIRALVFRPKQEFKEELAQYTFDPFRMTRLHGDDALDIMADCY